MNYLIAGVILALWLYVAMIFSWSPKASLTVNLFAGFMAVVLLGVVYWVPFWLIFLK